MNVLTLNPKLPAKAGVAEIYYHQPTEITERNLPARDNNVIRLPLHPAAEFHSILGGRQFVYSVPVRSPGNWRGGDSAFYFGGTDEEPFLVRLGIGAFGSFKSGGEDGLFDALKPDSIKRLESVFGWSSERQGDIFAIKVPFTWKALKVMRDLKRSKDDDTEPQGLIETEEPVFGTRHTLKGRGLRAEIPSLGETTLVEGLLRAPDHADLELKSPHILEQAESLFDPKNAD